MEITDQPTLPVTQADREAAASNIKRRLVWQHGGEQPWMDASTASMRMGEQDDHDEVQAFARHRTNSEPRPAGDLREAVERGAHALHEAEDSWNDYDWEYLPDTVKDSFRDQASHVIRALATHSPAPMAGEGAPDEDWLAGVIDDSLDMDWTGRVGAKAIIAAWGTRHD